ncbi:hypothetical protein DB346_02605 [Verrucomicrobia bacterium LW23]|nr:hypothetical protein DB346_04050 [Verrucomicrobia bacterium LW23]PTY04339.1 hypothetical protein DB346_02605 [Verrucomicrobia bacterium LW23]
MPLPRYILQLAIATLLLALAAASGVAQDPQAPSSPQLGPTLYDPPIIPPPPEEIPAMPPDPNEGFDPTVPAPQFTPLISDEEAAAAAAPSGESIEIRSDGDINADPATGLAVVTGNVQIRARGDEIFADYVMINNKTRDLYCRGNVRIYTATDIYRGESIDYNWDTKERKSLDFRLAGGPILSSGLTLRTLPEKPNVQQIRKGVFSTENVYSPTFRFKANTVNVYENEKVVLRNVTFYIGDVPFMWLPVYVQSLRSDKEGYSWLPGYSDAFGYFLLNRYGIILNDKFSMMLNLDYRQNRGFAGGVNVQYVGNPKDTKDKFFDFTSYVAQDNIYEQDFDLSSDAANYRYANVNSATRFDVSLKGRSSYMQDSWYLTDINVWSDPYVTLDFFPSLYSLNREPDNVVEAVQYTPNWTVNMLVRMQINSFFEAVERKPEVKWEAKRGRLFDTPITYEGETGMVNFERRFAKLVDNNPQRTGTGYSNFRYDTFHQFLYPRQYFNFLSFTPRVGVRGTYWSDNNLNLNDYDSEGNKDTDDAARFVFNAGFESSFKVSRAWPEIKSQQFGIDGIRHVFEPFTNAQFVYTTLDPEDIRGMDDRLPFASTSLPSINFPAYNTIDDIPTMGVVRMGIRNKIQTKRDGANWDLIDWMLAVDYDFRNNFSSTQSNLQYLTDANVRTSSSLLDERSNSSLRNLSSIVSDFRFRPVPWVTLNSKAAFDPTLGTITQFDTDLIFMPMRALQLGVGHRFIQDSLLYPDSNLFSINGFYRLNEHWQFSGNLILDTDDSTNTVTTTNGSTQKLDMIRSQQYSVHHDMSSWIVSLTLKRSQSNVYIDGVPRDDTSVFLTFTLKAFPGASLSTSTFNSN